MAVQCRFSFWEKSYSVQKDFGENVEAVEAWEQSVWVESKKRAKDECIP